MALQGTLETFALPDVLRLLASTKKTGCYRLEGDRGQGRLWVVDGQVVAGEYSGSSASEISEITFELLRFADGDFVFEADATTEDWDDTFEVEALLESAEALLEEWNDLAEVVPSREHWVSLRFELPSDEVVLRADQWIFVVAIGGGMPADALGSMLGQGEVALARTLKNLVELGVVEIGEPRYGEPAAAPASPVAPAPEPEPSPEPEPVTEPEPFAAFPPFGEDEQAETSSPMDNFLAEPAAREVEEAPAFEAFDPNDLFTDAPESAAAADTAFEPAPFGEPAPAEAAAPAADAAMDAAEIARQLANLSPKAAKAVAAAAKATTVEEREAALAEVDEDEEPINRELLLKFLGSVNG